MLVETTEQIQGKERETIIQGVERQLSAGCYTLARLSNETGVEAHILENMIQRKLAGFGHDCPATIRNSGGDN